jgi:hypothetical protein
MYEKRKRLDRNPASCKIQYPMKNQDKDAKALRLLQAGKYAFCGPAEGVGLKTSGFYNTRTERHGGTSKTVGG